jgi:RNA polymerase sigma factor (sigma-70 family)
MTAAQLHGDEAELFRRHNDHLLRIVRGLVVAPDALIEDACAMAWEQLMRHQPVRGPTLIGWLRVVAIREAWRLSSIQRRQPRLEDIVDPSSRGASFDETWEAVIPGSADTEREIEAKRALRVLAELPEKQRRYLSLLVGGHSYGEIMRATGATYTNVNKHLTRARASVRVAREAA